MVLINALRALQSLSFDMLASPSSNKTDIAPPPDKEDGSDPDEQLLADVPSQPLGDVVFNSNSAGWWKLSGSFRHAREDAVCVQFVCFGLKSQDLSSLANAPIFINTDPMKGKPLLEISKGEVSTKFDGIEHPPLTLMPWQTKELLTWLDRYFTGWRSMRGPYSFYSFRFVDFTRSELMAVSPDGSPVQLQPHSARMRVAR